MNVRQLAKRSRLLCALHLATSSWRPVLQLSKLKSQSRRTALNISSDNDCGSYNRTHKTQYFSESCL